MGSEYAGVTTLEPPHTNGAVTTAERSPRSPLRKWIIIGACVVFIGAWAWALTYSVTTGGRSPERLGASDASAVAHACLDAQRQLSALHQLGASPTATQTSARVSAEDRILSAMVARIRQLRPTQSTPATALTDWTSDWQRLITARQNFARDLLTKGATARFVEPATAGVDPIADKMNNWTLEQGTRTDACNTGELQAEVVQGQRTYGLASKS
jgi:hypothetical protein